MILRQAVKQDGAGRDSQPANFVAVQIKDRAVVQVNARVNGEPGEIGGHVERGAEVIGDDRRSRAVGQRERREDGIRVGIRHGRFDAEQCRAAGPRRVHKVGGLPSRAEVRAAGVVSPRIGQLNQGVGRGEAGGGAAGVYRVA